MPRDTTISDHSSRIPPSAARAVGPLPLVVQIDYDLAQEVWEKLDAASPCSPFVSCSLGSPVKKKSEEYQRSTMNIQEGEEAADADNFNDEGGDNAAAAGSTLRHALLWRMWRVTRPLVISQGLWQLVATLTEFVPSMAMQEIVDFVSSYKKGGEGVTGRITLFVVLLFVGPVVQGIADGRNFHLGRRIGCRVR